MYPGRFPIQLSVILAVVSSHASGTIGPEYCQRGNYREINDPRRNVKNMWIQGRGQPVLSDNDLDPGWYRFISGGKIPTKRVSSNHCGTIFPVWLDGNTTKPPSSPNDPVTIMLACSPRGIEEKCLYDISVKFCPGNFYVYYLKPTVNFSAYCTGKELIGYYKLFCTVFVS